MFQILIKMMVGKNIIWVECFSKIDKCSSLTVQESRLSLCKHFYEMANYTEKNRETILSLCA